MRASLPQTLRERRRSRDDGHQRNDPKTASERAAQLTIAASPSARTRAADLAVQRTREAGGPIDEASYACQCGFVFRAPVSTTVACPHCHAPQAW
jgi:hypothetical protein